jgi:hypothetical protein
MNAGCRIIVILPVASNLNDVKQAINFIYSSDCQSINL